MRIQTQGYSNKVWLSSDEGVINGIMTFTAATLEKILQAVNEKYGTSFEGWSQLPTAYEVGDTVPNWNAYEKIELQRQKIAANIAGAAPNDAYMVGEIVGKSFTILAGENGGCNTKSDGLVIAYSGPTAQKPDTVIRILGNYGIEIESVYNEIVNYEIGSYIPNWSEYEIIG